MPGTAIDRQKKKSHVNINEASEEIERSDNGCQEYFLLEK
jgi:hypothetical protein